ncbi:MAG: carbamoyl-phosphate synthase large subunit [Myxococcales bacterium]|nr:carbamoyl-phosphate synthase large subunit [Myxococcales bacterium]
MPRRPDIKKVLLIGSGPIVIGQACEFDYSGTQAIKALKEEGIEVVLLNSNPATIMTDPEFAHRTYLEPITVEAAERIIAQEKPDSLLPTMGGQTALNLAKALAEQGILQKYGVRLIGASLDAINKAEDRQLFKKAMERIGLELPKAGVATSMEEARALVKQTGYPAIIRPSFTLGGTGGGVAYTEEEFEQLAQSGLTASPVHSILIDESILGWKEYELEVVRDSKDNCIIICSIENFDPMGVHTGDSITVAPAQTLTDKEYERMRDASLAIMREIGVDTGGSNVQFGVDPKDGRMVVIEMNPRVSRSSALASKATGYPIAKIAAKLAIGYSLDELKNDITRDTPASFEPTIDYVVTKIPKFNFEKFPGSPKTLGTMMRSVGEVMAIGRTFRESYLKALRSLEQSKLPVPTKAIAQQRPAEERARLLKVPTPDRPQVVFEAFQVGMTVEQVFELTAMDPWFLRQLKAIVDELNALTAKGGLEKLSDAELKAAKARGFSDAQLAQAFGVTEAQVREHRWKRNVRPVYKRVDTCAAEFEAYTPYLYSTYEEEDEAPPTANKKIMILGSGPIRIGQGIEFDYCCVHAAFALRDAGFETIMVNCNPETVSTDYDTSDRLYFEPLTLEDVLEIVHREKPLGLIVQFGGQTPLKLSRALEAAGAPILGTTPDAIDQAEDRERFAKLVEELRLKQPENGVARSPKEAFKVAEGIGYPVMVRPSYVLGGRAMEVVHDQADLERYMREAVEASPEHPVLIDRFLQEATEVDLDLVVDSTGAAVVGGVLEHVEEAGVHSGDAACVLPPHSLAPETIERLKDIAIALSQKLKVVGLMNVQFAVQGKAIYVLEVNPRASRTVPFIAKATGVPLAKVAALCMAGKTLAELGLTEDPQVNHVAVKESVFPFARFPNTDVILGPEMKSTGEVMGLDARVENAFAKSQLASGTKLPQGGLAFLSVKDDDKPALVDLARRLRALGFSLCATGGTVDYLARKNITAERVKKVLEGGPHVVDRIVKGEIALVINTTAGKKEIADSYSIRRESLMRGVAHFTTMEAARMVVGALEAEKKGPREYRPIQEWLKTPALLHVAR